MALIPVLQSHLPQSMWSDLAMSRLPGVQPLRPGDWLIVDDAYAGQMALRDALIGDRRNAVIQMAKAARPAAEELLDLVLKVLDVTPGFSIAADAVIRPDGELVQLDRSEPLATLGRLVQEDFCLMQKTPTEHLLTGAVLCFPANWMLAEKFMAPLSTIHGPVAPYDANIARRVQRLFDAIQVARPLWRSNALYYDDPTLFSPNSEDGPRRAACRRTLRPLRAAMSGPDAENRCGRVFHSHLRREARGLVASAGAGHCRASPGAGIIRP